MPVPINFGGAVSGFSNLASAGIFGPSQSTTPAGFSNPSGGLLGDILNVANFGLDVFQTVRGDNRPVQNVAATPQIASSSTVPTPAGVVSRFTGNFAPGSIQTVNALPGATQAAASMQSIAPLARAGVAWVLRKIKANTGLRITTKKIVSAIRQFGPAAVATWAGVTMAELMIVWDRGSRRVKRRFTKRDRSRGRAYIRHLKRNVDELKSLGCGPKTRSPRRKC